MAGAFSGGGADGGRKSVRAKNSNVNAIAHGIATAKRRGRPGSSAKAGGPTFVFTVSEVRFVRGAGFPFGQGERRNVQFESLIRAIPDFPIPGILFRDITPLLSDPAGFRGAIDLFVDRYRDAKIDYVVGIEARGYMLGAPVAYALGAGFVPVRKPGKLPGRKFTEEYALEYGTNSIEIHADAVEHGKRVLVVDDLLATGGTLAATLRLLARLGAEIAGVAVLIELAALNGRAALPNVELTSFIRY